MNNDFNQFINQMERERRKHYTDFSLKFLAQSVGYTIRKIYLRPFTKQFGYKSGLDSIDTLRAEISLFINNSGGLLSQLYIFPHYHLTENDIANAPLLCEDLVIRFSIYPEGNGFFTPTWIHAIGHDYSIHPSGERIDWDILTNKAYKNTGIRSRQWKIPGMTLENATATYDGNIKAIKEMLKLWFMSGIKK